MKKSFLTPFLLLFLFAPVSRAQHTVTLNWVPSSTPGTATNPVLYTVYRETVAGTCPVNPPGAVIPGCLNLTPSNTAGITVSCPGTTTGSGCLSFVDTSPPQGETVLYVVRAVQGNIASVTSNEISVTVSLPSPAPPTSLTGKVSP